MNPKDLTPSQWDYLYDLTKNARGWRSCRALDDLERKGYVQSVWLYRNLYEYWLTAAGAEMVRAREEWQA